MTDYSMQCRPHSVGLSTLEAHSTFASDKIAEGHFRRQARAIAEATDIFRTFIVYETHTLRVLTSWFVLRDLRLMEQRTAEEQG